MKQKLSVVISSYNEEKKITDCLESVKWADEIIFVDNFSTDKTVEIAKKYTSKIFVKPNNLMLNVNKNFGFSKAQGEWILSLDSDERITAELSKEIKSKIEGNSKFQGYWIPRKNIIFGKWIQHGGWYPDYQLRLFKKGFGKFPQQHVHEMVKLTGVSGKLVEPITHYNYETIDQFLIKLSTIYTSNEAAQLIKNGYVFSYLDAISFPTKEFLSRFFAREGYKDGLHGLMLSLLMAFYHFIVFAKIWEKKKFISVDEDIVEGVSEEFGKNEKDLKYWFLKIKTGRSKNPLRKLYLKLGNKLK